jgi:hypothetical protein
MKKKNILLSFGGGKNQKKLIYEAIKRKISTYIIEYKKISFNKFFTHQIKSSCYNLKSIVKKKKLLTKISNEGDIDIIYRSSGPSVIVFYYISKILKINRISRKLAYSVYSKSFFCEVLKKKKLPYINYQVLSKFKKIEKFKEFVVKPDSPIIGKKYVYLINRFNKFSISMFERIKNRSHNNKVICSNYIEGYDLGIFVFIRKKNKKKFFLNPHFEKNKFINNVVVHKGFEKCRNDILNKKIIIMSKKILKIFPEYYGFLSITYRVENKKNIFPYEINLGLGGDRFAESVYFQRVFKQSPYSVEIKNLCL